MSVFASMTFAGVVAILSLLIASPAFADTEDFTLAYCSSDNTGSSSAANYSTWQSDGLCHDKCLADYAFAILLGNNCWCSDYIPANQEDTSDCDEGCPGYPSDKCGNTAKSLYAYISLSSHSPSGTQGASQASSTSVSTPPSSPAASSADATSTAPTPSSAPPSPVSSEVTQTPDLETVVHTVTASRQVVTVTPSSSPAPTTLQTGSSDSATTQAPSSASSVTSLLVKTVSGAVVTETVITAPATTGQPLTESQRKSTPVGPIVGGVVGGILGLAAIGALLFFFLRRRKQQEYDEDGQNNDGSNSKNGVHRNVSTMSKAGLLRGEKQPQFPPQIATTFSNSKRNSRHLDTESISPISASDRRNSRPYIFDQRLNPSAIMVLDNGSRGSFASLDDSRDYGRELNVRNPDPPRDSVDTRPSNMRN